MPDHARKASPEGAVAPVPPVRQRRATLAATPLQAVMQASPRVTQLLAMQQAMAARAVQRMAVEDEAPLQGKGLEDEEPLQAMAEDEEPLQAAGLEDEDPLQGRGLEDEEPLQGKANGAAPVQAKPGPGGNGGLPPQLRAGVEALSGHSMADVRVHRNSPQPAQVGALAYAQGRDIHLGPGQEKHLPHEAWHVVQQAQGRVRPTMQAKGVAINDDAGLEAEADRMGAAAQRMVLKGPPPAARVHGNSSRAVAQCMLPKALKKESKIQVYLDGEIMTVVLAKPFSPGDKLVSFRKSARKKKGKFVEPEQDIVADFAFPLGLGHKDIQADVAARAEAAEAVKGADGVDPGLLTLMYEKMSGIYAETSDIDGKPKVFSKTILAAAMIALEHQGYPCQTEEEAEIYTDSKDMMETYIAELTDELQSVGERDDAGPSTSAPGEGKSKKDWKAKATKRANAEVIGRLRDRTDIPKAEQAAAAEIARSNQLAHKIPKIRLKSLARSGVLAPEWSEKKLENWLPNLEAAVLPQNQDDEAREDFDPNVQADGRMTPRSEKLSEIDAMLTAGEHTKPGFDADDLRARLAEIEALHKAKLKAESGSEKGLTMPLLSQWSLEESGAFTRRRPDEKGQ